MLHTQLQVAYLPLRHGTAHLYVQLPFCLSGHLSVCLSFCCLLPTHSPAHSPDNLPACLYACLPVCLPVCLSVCLSVCLFVCLSADAPISACLAPVGSPSSRAHLSLCLSAGLYKQTNLSQRQSFLKRWEGWCLHEGQGRGGGTFL